MGKILRENFHPNHENNCRFVDRNYFGDGNIMNFDKQV